MGNQDYKADIEDLERKRETEGLSEDEKKELMWLKEQVAKGYLNDRY